jgi:alanine racemase
MSTRTDGVASRMQMFIFNGVLEALGEDRLVVTAPASVAAEYDTVGADFGPDAPTTITGTLVEAFDAPGGGTTTDGCEPITTDLTGQIALERRHAANTAALLQMPESHLDIVRPGIGLFGVDPTGSSDELKPVMRVISTVVALRDLQPGQAVGYGATWRAERPTRLATLPIGYADGLKRNTSNQRDVLIAGKRAPVVGAVSMDLTTVDVTDVPGVAVGDEVVVMGSQKGRAGEDSITAGEIARAQGTIPWEVLTQVSRRVPRFYRDA